MLALLFLIDSLSVQTQASSLGFLITFVSTFHFNLVLMFVYFAYQFFSNKLDLKEATNFIIIETDQVSMHASLIIPF